MGYSHPWAGGACVSALQGTRTEAVCGSSAREHNLRSFLLHAYGNRFLNAAGKLLTIINPTTVVKEAEAWGRT